MVCGKNRNAHMLNEPSLTIKGSETERHRGISSANRRDIGLRLADESHLTLRERNPFRK